MVIPGSDASDTHGPVEVPNEVWLGLKYLASISYPMEARLASINKLTADGYKEAAEWAHRNPEVYTYGLIYGFKPKAI